VLTGGGLSDPRDGDHRVDTTLRGASVANPCRGRARPAPLYPLESVSRR